MSELIHALPKEVVEFVAECRKKTYAEDAVPNYDTGNPYESGFRFENDGLVLVDVSTEQHRRFSGIEYVAIRSADKSLNGQKFYVCNYAGANEEYAKNFPNSLVDKVQHGMIIDNPTIARFGLPTVRLERSIEGISFIYQERSVSYPWGKINQEILFHNAIANNMYHPVYTGASLFTIFEIR